MPRQEEKEAKAIDYLAYMFFVLESKQTYEAERVTIRAWNTLPKELRKNYKSLARVTLSEIESILNR